MTAVPLHDQQTDGDQDRAEAEPGTGVERVELIERLMGRDEQEEAEGGGAERRSSDVASDLCGEVTGQGEGDEQPAGWREKKDPRRTADPVIQISLPAYSTPARAACSPTMSAPRSRPSVPAFA